MEMKQYLIDTFNFNHKANMQMIEKIKTLPDKTESIKLISHLINCQYRWMARILQDPKSKDMSWWSPIYDLSELHDKWTDCLQLWLEGLH